MAEAVNITLLAHLKESQRLYSNLKIIIHEVYMHILFFPWREVWARGRNLGIHSESCFCKSKQMAGHRKGAVERRGLGNCYI